MSSERRIFLVMFFVVVFNGSDACFLSSEHQITRSTTNSSFYWECLCNLTGYIADDLMMYDNNNLPVEPFRPGTNTNVYVEKQNDDEQQSLNLIIQSITKTTSGTYKCVAQVDGKIHTHSYTIDAYEPLYFYQTPVDQHLVYGRTSWITCQPKSETGVMIQWQKISEKDEPFEISDSEKYLQDYENNRLVIFNVTENDAGIYKCTARVVVTNEEADKNIVVKVMTEPEIVRITASPDDNNPTTVVAGRNLTIECMAEGMPHPEYSWNKTWEVGTPKSNVSWHQEINTIIFDSIKPEDSGVYTCYAFNPAGTSARNITIAVLSPPIITNFTDITAIQGSTVEIFCNATGTPTPSISITFEGDLNEDLDETKDFEHLPNNHSMFLELSKQGVYVCNASNEVDSVEKQMYLTVLHRPYFDMLEENVWGWEGKTINLNCDQDSNPRAIVTWRFEGNKMPVDEDLNINKKLLSTLNNMPEPYFTLTIDNETAYGIYECTARNELGTATKLIKLIEGFRPGNVNNISSEDPTATSVTFHMEGPDHVDGPDVIGFTASFDEEKNYNITDIHKNRTWEIVRPFKLDKLKPNTTYWVRFAAVNEVGPGPWSNFYNFTTLDKSVPEPPVWNEEPIILTGNSPVLKWKAPDDNGEPIDYYILKYCSVEEDESCVTRRISPSTELELDLESNTTYFLELVAHNAEGDSVPANVSVNVPVSLLDLPTTQLSGGAIIGISIVIVLLCLLLLDVFLLVWRRQGIIATCCCYKKDTKRKESPLNSSIAKTDAPTKLPLLQNSATTTYSDKKGLLTSGETEERAASLRNNGHKEFEYNKSTGVVTGKHSAV